MDTHAHHHGSGSLNDDALGLRMLELERIVTAHGHKLQVSQPGFPAGGIHRKLALPIPLGTFGIGAVTWFLGLLLLQTRSTTLPNAWILNGLPFGVLTTSLAGVGEFFTGNTFGCALFSSVAGILLGLNAPFLPWTGIAQAFGAAADGNVQLATQQLNVAVGIYLFIAFGVLFVLLIGSQRTAVAIVVSIVLINLVMICFGAGNITGNHKCITAAGAFLIAVSFNLWYIGLALLLLESRNPLAKFFPLGSLAPKS